MDLQKFKFSSVVWVLIAGTLASRLGTSMTIPFLSFFLHVKMGISLTNVGIIIGASFLAFALGGFWGGVLSDLFGRKKLLLLSFLSYALVFILFGLTSNFLQHSVYVGIAFFILNIASGACRSWCEILSQAMIGDLAPPEQKVSAFGMRYIAANIGTALGPAFGVLLGFTGNALSFYITGGILLIYFIIFYFFLLQYQERNNTSVNINNLGFKQAAAILFRDKAFVYFILGCSLIFFGFAQPDAVVAQIVYIRLNELTTFSIMLILNALLVIILQIPISQYLSTRFQPLSIILGGVILISAGLSGYGVATTSFWFIFSEIIFTLGEILVFSYISVVTDSLAPDHLRGAYFGASSLQFFGRAAGPMVSGFLLEKLGIASSMLIVALITLSSCIFLWLGIAKMKDRKIDNQQ